MSELVTFYGASDDLVEVEGKVPGCDEYNAEDAHFVVTGPEGSLRVRVWYTKRGVWAVAAAPTDESAPMLKAQVGPTVANGYSARLTVLAADLVVHEVAA